MNNKERAAFREEGEVIMSVLHDKQDARIREALKQADKRGRLGVVAAVTGIAGGERELRKIARKMADEGLVRLSEDLGWYLTIKGQNAARNL
ncbi:hypothetical protein [Allopusillimonas ginsengisoli]|uniref:hypothetical protein n=1 Tax=Allopusillimonas ginsengisoli TaxID=453575 RepID=UPI0010215255|nr:hypothetical protein [Allopusillimonas ginsengisoli]TEA78685.1 hypothetical protein ERE07_09835 [Allopusillimonas ginsengisoli]